MVNNMSRLSNIPLLAPPLSDRIGSCGRRLVAPFFLAIALLSLAVPANAAEEGDCMIPFLKFSNGQVREFFAPCPNSNQTPGNQARLGNRNPTMSEERSEQVNRQFKYDEEQVEPVE